MKVTTLTLTGIVDALVADGVVAEEETQQFKKLRSIVSSNMHPISLIAKQGWKSLLPAYRILDAESLTRWFAQHVGLEYFYIDPLKIKLAEVTEVMSSVYATKNRILPVAVSANEVVIATADPFDRNWEAELQPMLRKSVRRVIANPEDIARYQVEFWYLAQSVKGAMARGGTSSGIANFEQLIELGKGHASLDANDQHVVHLVDWLWQYAFEQRASDIHIEPRREMGIVRFRIDGTLQVVYQLPMPVLHAMSSRIKILGRMDVIEKRRPQDGRIKTRSPAGQEIELRLSTLPTAFGEKLVMRVFDPEVLVRKFSDLGFGEEDLARWQSMTTQPNGIILVTGPTGSGKTSTLYTTLRQLATTEVNVCTLEDPIEMIEPSFNQMQVQPDIGISFSEGIRALMRQDPDIIMIGEIRDSETADMALQAALTGHLVLSSLHTTDAPSAITRLLDLGTPAYLLQASLIGVMAQRLVRTLCPHCKTMEKISGADNETWSALANPWIKQTPTSLYYSVGCLSCRNTGYLGRIGLYEVMPVLNNIKRLIVANANLASIREASYTNRMLPLRVAGIMKVISGLTTVEEVRRVAPPANS